MREELTEAGVRAIEQLNEQKPWRSPDLAMSADDFAFELVLEQLKHDAGASSESAMRTASAAHAQNNECFAAEIDASVRDTLDFGRRVNALREQLSEGDNNDSLKHTLFLRQTALR